MKQFIVDTTEPDTLLLETDCPVNEEAIIECITAVWGKAFSLAYVFFLGCCIEMYVFLFYGPDIHGMGLHGICLSSQHFC
ncbi:MAG TPA: hypothetical protein IAB83_04100 [Candidatus Faecousia faecavium]|nr:hypothetical protein [Candidatus Faecousia faecavium]